MTSTDAPGTTSAPSSVRYSRSDCRRCSPSDRDPDLGHPRLLAALAIVCALCTSKTLGSPSTNPHHRPPTTEPQLDHGETVQRAIRHHHPAPLQQHVHRRHAQPLLKPAADLLTMPRRGTPTRSRCPAAPPGTPRRTAPSTAHRRAGPARHRGPARRPCRPRLASTPASVVSRSDRPSNTRGLFHLDQDTPR